MTTAAVHFALLKQTAPGLRQPTNLCDGAVVRVWTYHRSLVTCQRCLTALTSQPSAAPRTESASSQKDAES